MKPILWFREITKADVPLVGGKGANLGEMANHNFPIPPGFIVTAQSYFRWLEERGIRETVNKTADSIDVENAAELKEKSSEIRELILSTPTDKELEIEIMKAYSKLGEKKLGLGSLTSSEEVYVAIRSSATAEDLPEASFAGQQETYLNVIGRKAVVESVKKCWASLFTARAVYYRRKNNFETANVGIAVVVQKMVDAEVSGVVFTADPTGDESRIVIEAAYGLGEVVVGGLLTPDRYIVDKGSVKITEKNVAKQVWKITRAAKMNRKEDVQPKVQEKQKLSDKHIVQLAKIGKQIENHYGIPMDIEWALERNELYIVQARAITTLGLAKEKREEIKTEGFSVIASGIAASPGVGIGKAKVVLGLEEIEKIEKGDVLITKMTSPDWVPIMKKSAAIVTDEGGSTCHASIVSRELGIPCVVGTENGSSNIKDGATVTVDGYEGKVYLGAVKTEEHVKEEVRVIEPSEVDRLEEAIKGIRKELPEEAAKEAGVIEKRYEKLPYEKMPEKGKENEEELLISFLRKVAPLVKVNVALPEAAENAAKTDADGVGLLRAEHMITAKGVHPAEYIRRGEADKLKDAVKEGIKKVASLFAGKPVWYRTFDARTDEFRQLEGGEKEPEEDNPMLGWHGIRRDLDESEMLRAQFGAVKELSDEGITNVGIMLPFVISAEEVRKAKGIAAETGLLADGGTDFGVMVETPASVWAIDEIIAEGINFISFGTNDLTQLTLGIDRNNERIQGLFSEMHPAMLREIAHVIRKCREAGVKTSICGQAASDPEMVRKLVRFGIDSVSANIDAVEEIRGIVLEEEKNIILERKHKK
jgi:pyruvate,water dikinase